MLSHHQKELSRERERDMLRDRDVRGKTSQENDVSKKMSPERFVARRRRQENERLFRSWTSTFGGRLAGANCFSSFSNSIRGRSFAEKQCCFQLSFREARTKRFFERELVHAPNQVLVNTKHDSTNVQETAVQPLRSGFRSCADNARIMHTSWLIGWTFRFDPSIWLLFIVAPLCWNCVLANGIGVVQHRWLLRVSACF